MGTCPSLRWNGSGSIGSLDVDAVAKEFTRLDLDSNWIYQPWASSYCKLISSRWHNWLDMYWLLLSNKVFYLNNVECCDKWHYTRFSPLDQHLTGRKMYFWERGVNYGIGHWLRRRGEWNSQGKIPPRLEHWSWRGWRRWIHLPGQSWAVGEWHSFRAVSRGDVLILWKATLSAVQCFKKAQTHTHIPVLNTRTHILLGESPCTPKVDPEKQSRRISPTSSSSSSSMM